MKNTLNKNITALAVSICILIASMAQGMRPFTPVVNRERRGIRPSTTIRQKPILLAENEENTTEDKAQTATGTKGRVSKPEPDPETDNKDPSAKSATAPLKPFKPSDEIAAEQAVDFPVDI